VPIYLSWNVYHGSIGAQTVQQRVGQIVTFGIANNVDVICLQEVPKNQLDAVTAFGATTNIAAIHAYLDLTIPNWKNTYTLLQAYSENNPNGPNQANTADGYLIFYRGATYNAYANFGYYQAPTFQSLIGTTLRPPVTVDLTLAAGGGQVRVMNWHADTGAPFVTSAVVQLNVQLGNGNAVAQPTIVAGDFNYAGPINNLFTGTGVVGFPNWDDMRGVVRNAAGAVLSNGLDHILTSGNANAVLAAGLSFRSDAYHYPIAVNV